MCGLFDLLHVHTGDIRHIYTQSFNAARLNQSINVPEKKQTQNVNYRG